MSNSDVDPAAISEIERLETEEWLEFGALQP